MNALRIHNLKGDLFSTDTVSGFTSSKPNFPYLFLIKRLKLIIYHENLKN